MGCVYSLDFIAFLIVSVQLWSSAIFVMKYFLMEFEGMSGNILEH